VVLVFLKIFFSYVVLLEMKLPWKGCRFQRAVDSQRAVDRYVLLLNYYYNSIYSIWLVYFERVRFENEKNWHFFPSLYISTYYLIVYTWYTSTIL
jgi:hypothetical protein